MQFLRYIPYNLDIFSDYDVIDDFIANNNHCIIYRKEEATHLAIGNFRGNGTDVIAIFIWEDYYSQNEIMQNRIIASSFAVHFRTMYSSTVEIVKGNFPTSIIDRVKLLHSKYGNELNQNRGNTIVSYYNIASVEEICMNVWSVILLDNPYMTLNNENAAKDIARLISSDIHQFIDMRWK